MPKRAGIVFVVIGAVLMISALLLFFYNSAESAQAGSKSDEVLTDLQAIIAERQENKDDDTTRKPEDGNEEIGEAEETEPDEDAVFAVEVNGYSCIGILYIPDIEVALPVLSDWDYIRLTVAPCRQFGSPQTDDLVIAAHNYSSHFGSLSKLEQGAEVTFVDLDGVVRNYALSKIETVASDAVETVRNSEHDLVLYTCTYGGQTRVVAFCDRVDN